MRPPLIDEDGEVREITAEDMKYFKPARDVDPQLVDAMSKIQRTRQEQKSPKKTPISLRLDPHIVDHFKATGKGWQTRINQALSRIVAEEETETV